MSRPRGGRRLPLAPLSEAAWPALDRHAWAIARSGNDPLEDPGLAAHWASGTTEHTAYCYGAWLAWLAAEGELEPTTLPAERVTRARARRYLTWLQAVLAPETVATMMTRLHEVIRVMAPGADVRWLRAGATRLHRRAVPVRNKLPKLVAVDRLVTAGFAVMAQAETASLPPRRRALLYRDGLVLAFLALRPVRVSNLAAMRLDQHIVRDDDTIHVRFSAGEVKNRRPLEFSWPTCLLDPLHTYLEVHRPALLADTETPVLWLGRKGPLTVSGITQVILAATKREFGEALNPHMFRDCAATTVATQDPEHARIIASILGHARPETSERYYNHAQSMAAGRAYQEIVRRQRGSRGRRSSASRTGAGS
jgi:integrase/recombinase XerD